MPKWYYFSISYLQLNTPKQDVDAEVKENKIRKKLNHITCIYNLNSYLYHIISDTEGKMHEQYLTKKIKCKFCT